MDSQEHHSRRRSTTHVLAGLYFSDSEQEASPTTPQNPEPLASSSPDRNYPSSPNLPSLIGYDGKTVNELSDLESDGDSSDGTYHRKPTPTPRAPPMSDTEKAARVLDCMRSIPRFSLYNFLDIVFKQENEDVITASNSTSNNSRDTSNTPQAKVRKSAGLFLSENRHIDIMKLWWNRCGGAVHGRNEQMKEWVVSQTEVLCAKEAGYLTDNASHGCFRKEAESLRVSASKVTVETVKSFRHEKLTSLYDKTTPYLQRILKAVIAKPLPLAPNVRDPNPGRTLATSMLLNLRSRQTNYHAAINVIILWANHVPKRMAQMFNLYGVCSSYPFQARAMTALSWDSLLLARISANNPLKIKMVPYDNFNWLKRVWEATLLNRSVTHDQVSALLVVIPTPAQSTAQEIMDVHRLVKLEGTRLKIPSRQALRDILPSSFDHQEFRSNSIIHVQQILAEEVKDFNQFLSFIPDITDPHAIVPQKTEEYYLPTFDQEQGSTRGNMIVLEHYLGKVLKLPPEAFESSMILVLGDRLTTARDRAAQDQRAVDRSTSRFHRLESVALVSGLMHFCLNFMQALGRSCWGGTTSNTDTVSLSSLRDALPNRTDINPRKVDFYAWLRFLDVVLRALTVRAASVVLQLGNLTEVEVQSYDDFTALAAKIVDTRLIPSPSFLENAKIKTIPGPTESSHAVMLMHNLMTLREMRHSIKAGHPQRIMRMIKYWTPMFYAAGSYNYANESMELLHNMTHDWPADFAAVAFSGMLFNSSGQPNEFKETDLRVEHLNNQIKSHTHGSNASPEVLEKITPAIGHLQDLTDQISRELGVEFANQKHAKVLQHKDVSILKTYLTKAQIFDFTADQKSPHSVPNLYYDGIYRLSGEHGGHAKHLKRHALRLRKRHANNASDSEGMEVDTEDEEENESDLSSFEFRMGSNMGEVGSYFEDLERAFEEYVEEDDY